MTTQPTPRPSKLEQLQRVMKVRFRMLDEDEQILADARSINRKIVKKLDELDQLPGTLDVHTELEERRLHAAWLAVRGSKKGVKELTTLLSDTEKAVRAARKRLEELNRARDKNFQAGAKAAKAKAKYETLRDDIRRRMKYFVDDPVGIELGVRHPKVFEKAMDVRGALIDANRLATGQDFTLAAKELKTAEKAVTWLEKFLASWQTTTVTDKAVTKASKSFQDLLGQNADKLTIDYATAKTKELFDILLDVGQGKLDAEAGRLRIEGLEQTVRQEVEGNVRRTEALTRRLEALRNAIDLLVPISLHAEIGEHFVALSKLRALFGKREHDACESGATTLEAALLIDRRTLEESDRAWQIEKRKLSTLSGLPKPPSVVDDGIRLPYPPGALVSESDELPGRVYVSLTSREAIVAVADLERRLRENQDVADAWLLLGDAREAADLEVTRARERCDEAVEALREALKKRLSAEPFDTGGLATRTKTALADWADLRGSTTDAGKLDPAPTVKELGEIARLATEILNDEGQLAELETADRVGALFAKLTLDGRQMDKALLLLAVYPDKRLGEWQKKRTKVGTTLEALRLEHAAKNPVLPELIKLQEASDEVRHDMGEQQLRLGVEIAERQRKVKLRCEALKTEQIPKLAKKAAKKAWSTPLVKTRQTALAEIPSLNQRVDRVFASAETRVAMVLGMCEDTATILEETLQTWLVAVEGQGAPPYTYDNVAEAIAALRADLKTDERARQRYAPSKVTAITEAIDDVAGRMHSSENTTRLIAELLALRNDQLAKLVEAVDQAKELHQRFDEKYDVVRKEWKEQKDRVREYPRYRKLVEGLFDEAKSLSKQEDKWIDAGNKLDDARARIKEIKTWHNDYGTNLGEKLKEKEDALAQEENDLHERGEVFAVRLREFEDKFLPLVKRKEAKEQIEQLVKTAKSRADAKQYDSAEQVLEQARERVNFLRQFPDGPPSVTSLAGLRPAEQAWRRAVEDYGRTLGQFAKRFETTGAAGALAKHVEELDTTFDPLAFDPHVTTIVASGTDLRTRLTHRESALKRVRDYKERLVKDTRFALLAAHPFDDLKVKFGASTLYTPLVDLERLLLMAVPTT